MIHRASRSPAIVATASPVGTGVGPRSRIMRSRSAKASGPAASRDRAVDPAAGAQRRVRRVHDRIDRLLGDVALHEFDPRSIDPSYGPPPPQERGARPTRRPGVVGRLHGVDLDLLVLGDANPDLVMRGDDVAPAFGQAERFVDDAWLTVGGSGAIMACGAARSGCGSRSSGSSVTTFRNVHA